MLYQGCVVLCLLDHLLLQVYCIYRAIYGKVKDAVSEDERDVYTGRLQELEVKMRFCRHHLGDRTATDTLLAMRDNEALGDKLDVSIRWPQSLRIAWRISR